MHTLGVCFLSLLFVVGVGAGVAVAVGCCWLLLYLPFIEFFDLRPAFLPRAERVLAEATASVVFGGEGKSRGRTKEEGHDGRCLGATSGCHLQASFLV